MSTLEDKGITKRVVVDGIIPLIARLLLSVIFFTSSIAKIFSWSGNIAYIESKHFPFAGVSLACALAVEFAGWICLVTGYRARLAASIMFLYMLPVTLVFHDFMSVQFQKNLGIMGGLLLIASYGPGAFALMKRRPPVSNPSGTAVPPPTDRGHS